MNLKVINDMIKPLLAIIVVLCTFAYFFTLLFTDKKADPQIITALVVTWQIPLSYYFGSSSGTAKKDETISDLTQQNNNQLNK